MVVRCGFYIFGLNGKKLSGLTGCIFSYKVLPIPVLRVFFTILIHVEKLLECC